MPLPPIVHPVARAVADRVRRRSDIVGQTVEVNGLPREVIGIMPPGADVMDNRTEIWMPLGLNPGNRQNRGSHFLYLIGRLKDGVTPQQAQTRADRADSELGRARRREEARLRAAAAPAQADGRPSPARATSCR